MARNLRTRLRLLARETKMTSKRRLKLFLYCSFKKELTRNNEYVTVPLVGQYSGASFLPFVRDSSRWRETVAASMAGSSLAVSMWPDLTWLLLYDSDQRRRGQWERMSSMEVGIWRRIMTGGKTDGQRSAPSLSPLWWQWRVGLSISLSQASAAVAGALYPPLHPTSLSVAALRRSGRDSQSMRGSSRSGMPGGRSVARCGDW